MKDKEFNLILKDIIINKTVLEMKKYNQHYNTSCFDHCYQVSYMCYKLGKKLKLDYKSLAVGAMLHDLFLYDWRLPKKDRVEKGLHAFTHGKRALDNANKLFKLNYIEQDMILNHMWPLTLRIPKTKECFLLTIIDKYSAFLEIKKGIILSLEKNYYIKYASVMYILLINHLY